MAITNVTDLISQAESCRLEAYRDQGGVPTIGFGHTAGVQMGDTCTQEQADEWRNEDILTATEGARAVVGPKTWGSLNDARQAAIIDQCYNIGQTKLAGFHNMLRALVTGDWEEAAEQMLSSRWAGQVGDRATRDALMMVSGNWPE